jgi:hypothetical protein
VFETGFGFTALLPHVSAARQVARIASLRVRRAVEREDFEAAIRDVEIVLRLARDLQPRGHVISQLVSSAITLIVGKDMITPILIAPGLRAGHCDRLLKVLVEHEAKSPDGYVEGLRTEYVTFRVGLPELIQDPERVGKALGIRKQDGQSTVRALVEALGSRDTARTLPADADSKIRQTTPAELARQVEKVNGVYRTLLGLDGVPYAARQQKFATVRMLGGTDTLSILVQRTGLSQPLLGGFVQALAHAKATVRAMECWAALRRWELSHRGRPPRELVSATKAAGLKDVPVDPYDGKPMRLAILNGRPIIYSVGKDGRDDGGQIDSKQDVQPSGDLIYRPESTEARR